MTLCGECGHPRAHHGHYGPKGNGMAGQWGWIDEGKCWVYVVQKRRPHGCKCKGWK